MQRCQISGLIVLFLLQINKLLNNINNLVLGAMLFPLAVFAQQLDYSKAIPFDSTVKTGKLENGLTYYIKKNAKP